jgi:hypothetical protein
MWPFLRVFYAVLAILTAFATDGAHKGRVVDAVTGDGISGATVSAGAVAVETDADGNFEIAGSPLRIAARAAGYRQSGPVDFASEGEVIRLTPFKARALYLSFYGVGSKALLESALDLIHNSAGLLNSVVVDVKGDRGLVAFKTGTTLAHEIGADKTTTIPDLPALIKRLHSEGIYAIIRIVVFKDEPLASARPDLAVSTSAGAVFYDREELAWTDPFRREVWDYNIDIAVEAARAGFDEIQFDYLRFPDPKNIRFSEANTMKSRRAAITGFLSEARQRLMPYIWRPIFSDMSAGNTDDTGIGQSLDNSVPLIDYISPMLYSSGFTFGIPGYRDPVQHPYEIVRLSLDRARARTGALPQKFRPWLQAFKDYAFDRRAFDSDEMQPQIRAAEEFGSGGWMIWNPRKCVYQTRL